MKKVLAILAAAGLMAAATTAFGASIVNSKHNLSETGTGGLHGTAGVNSTQICVYCHAPHGAIKSIPLWNRNNPDPTTFILYSGINMQSRQFATGFTSDSTSLFCMSCHDGQTQMDNVHNQGANIRANLSGGTGLPLVGGLVQGNPALGTDLSLTHPVNFPVPTANNAQNDLWVGSGSYMGGSGPAGNVFPLYKATSDGGSMSPDRTSDRSLECGSCHAVHDSLNSPFLRYTLSGSQLCLGCHNK